jgi:hypothetical protein
MKYAAIALAVGILALAGTPVMSENPVEPAAPGSDKTPGVTPNDANASPPTVDTGKETGTSNTGKETGASNPDTPDPTKNTPGAESKN